MSAGTLALGQKRQQQATEIFQASLDWVIRDAESAAPQARGFGTVQRWHDRLQTRIGVAAFGTGVIPFGMALELPYLFRLMGRGAIGTGKLMGAKIEAETDLPAIFALWSGAIDKSALATAQGGVVIVDSVAYPAFGAKVLALGFKIGVKAAAANVGGVAGSAIGIGAGALGHMLQPILAKIAAKVSVKISAKVGAKTVVGFVPLLGAAASVGISLYILHEFLTSAQLYYEHKVNDAGAP